MLDQPCVTNLRNFKRLHFERTLSSTYISTGFQTSLQAYDLFIYTQLFDN